MVPRQPVILCRFVVQVSVNRFSIRVVVSKRRVDLRYDLIIVSAVYVCSCAGACVQQAQKGP
jgi:hypothetical protein